MAILLLSTVTDPSAQTLNPDWWHTSGGAVHSMVSSSDGSVIYMGGSFNYVGPVVRNGALLGLEDGQPTLGLPSPDQRVLCTIEDGAGGWYIGGAFDQVGDQSRSKVARINADGTLSAWQVEVDADVEALLLDGSTLYVGGPFTTVAGESRSGVAAVDANTGALLPFAPELAAPLYPRVRAFAMVGENLIMGGNFEMVDGSMRDYLAAVNKVSGALTTWTPDPANQVFSLLVSDDASTLYVGGTFTAIAGQSRMRTAAFNTSTFALLPFNAQASDVVNSMDMEDGVLVLGGEFGTLGGQPRENLGAVDASSGAVLPWVANADDDVYAVLIDDGVVHVAGSFTELDGVVRRYIGAVDLATAEVTAWDPVSGDDVFTLCLSGDQLYAGGGYTSIGGKVRNKLMAMDPATGQPTDWDPNAANDYGSVFQLRINPNGQVIYAAGSFNNEVIGGQLRKHLVALDAMTGLAYPWAPQPSGQVADIELSPDGTVLYAAGGFTSIAGVQRNRLAAFNADPQVTELLPWDPNCTAGSALCLELSGDGSTLYVGGTFQASTGTVGGQPRDRIAALNTSIATNNATSWTAPLTGPPAIGSFSAAVYSLLLDPAGQTLYIGGFFNGAAGHAVSGQPRDNLAAVSVSTGSALPWDPGTNDRIIELKWSGDGSLMVCGVFDGADAIGGSERQGFALVDPMTGVVGPALVEMNFGGNISEAEEFDGLLVLSGFFNEMNGEPRLALAAFDLPPSAVAELESPGSIVVNPNPTTGIVLLPSVPDARRSILFDGTGRVVWQDSFSRTLDLAAQPSGLYLLVFQDADGKEIGRSRVVVER